MQGDVLHNTGITWKAEAGLTCCKVQTLDVKKGNIFKDAEHCSQSSVRAREGLLGFAEQRDALEATHQLFIYKRMQLHGAWKQFVLVSRSSIPPEPLFTSERFSDRS